ncbi:MAG: histidine kinase dimerization/phosphoacceptor domain -containing protein, partial [Bacteroidota bacterium]
IMEALWDHDAPASAQDIFDYVAATRDWSLATVKTREYWISKVQKIATDNNSDILMGRVHLMLIAHCVNDHDQIKLDRLKNHLKQDYKQNNNQISKGILMLANGNSKVIQRDFKQGEIHLLNALNHFEKLQLDRFVNIAHQSLGNLWIHANDNTRALRYFLKSHEYFSRTKDPLRRAVASYQIALVYYQNKNYAKSLQYYKRSWRTLKSAQGNFFQLHSAAGIFSSYVELKDYRAAEEQLNTIKALPLFTEQDERTFVYVGAMESLLRLRQGKYGECIILADNLLPIIEKNIPKHPRIYQNILNFKFASQYYVKNYIGARVTINELMLIDSSKLEITTLKEAYEALYKIDSAEGKYRNALGHHKMFAKITDSITTLNENVEISRLQTEYNLKEKDNEIANLKVIRKEQELENTKRESALYVVGLLLVVFFVATFLLYKNNRTKVKTNKELHDKELVLERALKDKELLLKEIHHRVKNNLQFINSMLAMQARPLKKDNEKLKIYLEKAESRIHSMAIIHQILYESESLDQINFKKYLGKLIDAIKKSYPEKNIMYSLNLKETYLNLNTSLNLGLIAHEVILNALKHAFHTGNSGEISVSLMNLNGSVEFIVEDNGKGIETQRKGKGTFGMDLIALLSEQINATVQRTNAPGHMFKLIFSPQQTS